METIKFDPLIDKSPVGAVSVGDIITLRVCVNGRSEKVLDGIGEQELASKNIITINTISIIEDIIPVNCSPKDNGKLKEMSEQGFEEKESSSAESINIANNTRNISTQNSTSPVDNISSITFMIREDRDDSYTMAEMKRKDNYFTLNFKVDKFGHYFFNFQVNINGELFYLNKTYDSYSYLSRDKGDDFVQIVTSEKYDCCDSLQGGLIYQIMVDRFCKVGKVNTREPLIYREDWGGEIKKFTSDPEKINMQVFGGNFKGVISKLDYLSDLGVTAIYFTPISLANSHHKYDTADYMKIDDMFGTESDFKKLVKLARSKGIKIIIDGVYNHTGADSIYFNRESRYDSIGAYNSVDSRYYNWYSFSQYPSSYDSWWGIDTLPSIKKDCRDFQEFIAGENGVIDKFLSYGVFGIRLDVVDELSDEFVKRISDKIRSYGKEHACIGEVWEDASTKISYGNRRHYFTKRELNSVMNYPLKSSILDYLSSKNPYNLNSTIRMLVNNYPKVVLDNLMCSLGTHDTSRLMSEVKSICGLDGYDIDLKNMVISDKCKSFSLECYSERLEEYRKSNAKINYNFRYNNDDFDDDGTVDFNDDKISNDYDYLLKSQDNFKADKIIGNLKYYDEFGNKKDVKTIENKEEFLVLEKFDKMIKLVKIANVLIFTLTGVTTIFYGDEYGMENSGDNSRGCFDWNNYDNMIYSFVKSLSKIRKNSVFKDGDIKVVLSTDGKFVFSRSNSDSEIYVFINLGYSNLSVDLKGNFKSMISGEKYKNIIVHENEFEILLSER